ncbi:MAG: phosphatase PAP2 family protein [Candidatus Moraniibacteriota bacterium]
METIIIFGAQYLYLLIVLVALAYIWRQPREQRWKIILCAAIALPLTYIAAKILSQLYYDPRPFVVGQFAPLLPHDADNGFPSDHTLLGSAVAAVIFLFNRKIGNTLFIIAFLVGASRVFAGIHHFTDIFGSMAIAAATTYVVCEYIFPKAWERFSQKYFDAL